MEQRKLKRETMSDDNQPKELAGAPDSDGASGRLRVRVCSSCAMDKPELAAVVREMQARYAERIHFQFEECLDLCDFSPSTIVGDTVLAPASPQHFREEIEYALSQSLREGGVTTT